MINLKYVRKLLPIINKVGMKHNIPADEGMFIIDAFFKTLRDWLTDPRVPRIRIPNFGTLNPQRRYINRSLRASIRWYRAGGLTYDYLKARISRIWRVRNRLALEEQGYETWRAWHKIPSKNEFKKLEEYEQEERRKSNEKIYRSGGDAKKSKDIFRKL